MAGASLERLQYAYIQPREPKGGFAARERTLTKEMDYLRNNWQKEGLSSDWVDLPDMGFLINYQIGFLDSEKFGKVLSSEEKKHLWIEKTEFDIRGWVREKLQRALLYPGRLSIQNSNGKWQLTDTRHGAQMDIEDTLSPKERNGSVRKVHVEVVKPFLINASDESIAVIISPSGPSGILDEKGDMINYEDSHFDILQKKGNEIYEYTICTDFTYQEHREVLKQLRRLSEQPDPNLSKDSSVEDYILSPALFESSKKQFAVKDIIDVLRDARFNITGGGLYAFKNRFWEEVYQDIEKEFEELWRFDDVTESYISEFTNFVRYKHLNREDLKYTLAVTLLRLSRYVLGGEKEEKIKRLLPGTVELNFYSYGQAYKEAALIPGCAGGGGREKVKSILGIDKTEVMSCVTCPFCKETVNAILTKDKIICPSCKKSASRSS